MENFLNENNELFKYFLGDENLTEYIDTIRSIGGLQPKILTYGILLKDNLSVVSQIGDITRNNSPIIPTDETFSIWSIIYTRLAPFSFIPSRKWVRDLFKAQQIFNSGWLNNFVKEDVKISDAVVALRNLRYLGCSLINLYDILLYSNNCLCRRILTTLRIYYTWVAGATIFQIIINKNLVNPNLTKDEAFDICVIELNKLLASKDLLYKGTLEWTISGLINNPSNDLTIEQINELIKIAKEFGITDTEKLLKQGRICSYVPILC